MKMKITMSFKSLVIASIMQCFSLSLALGHSGYFTTYNHHVHKGETGFMILTDFTNPSRPKREKDNHGEYFSQMLELKYNPTNQLALEFMWEGFEDIEKGGGKYTGARYEARYRLFEEEILLNPMIYAEYEDLHPATRYKMEVSGWIEPPYQEEAEPEANREKILESRFILSQDLGSWNIAFDWINESDLSSGLAAFGYALGVLYRIDSDMFGGGDGERFFRPVSFAFEIFGALGDTKKFGLQPSRQEHYFQPSIAFFVGKKSMLSVGYGLGLSGSSDDLARLAWGQRF